MARLVIDGRAITVNQGSTLLDAARSLGIHIPTLCYHRALEPHAGCRLCLVEIVGQKELQAACAYPAESGLEVLTSSPRVRRARRLVAGLLYLRCPEEPRIQSLASEMGVEVGKLRERFTPDAERCILCDLCVRICKERMRVNAFDYVNRGHLRKWSAPFRRPSPLCLACGACQSVCPLGAVDLAEIASRLPRPIPSEHEAGLVQRGPVYIPFPQAVPRVPVIDRDNCVYFQRGTCQTCEVFCEAQAIERDQRDQIATFEVGAVVLATGTRLMSADVARVYGYGRFPNVVTNLQLERMLSASGPSGGHVLRPSDGQPPGRVAFIQCVGSRDTAHPYCSSTCCMATAKEALLIKEQLPGTECTVFYTDLRACGKNDEDFHRRVLQAGVRYLRCRPSVLRERAGSHNLAVQAVVEGEIISQEFDLVVLAMGTEPSSAGVAVAASLGARLDQYGFCEEALPASSPLEGTRIFPAGTASGPKDVSESVIGGLAAAARAMEAIEASPSPARMEHNRPPVVPAGSEEIRVGVFVCHCGRNIREVVDVSQVVARARELPGVAHSTHMLYACSADSLERLKADIAKYRLNRVVVAGCSPRTHEGTFQRALQQAGLNPYVLEMANIRDQCSWVHADAPAMATEKAGDLVAMAAARARLMCPLHPASTPVTHRALVVGAGVAGMVAALSLANQRFPVTLLEKEARPGGNALRLRFYSNDPSSSGTDPYPYVLGLSDRVAKHPLIELHTGTQLDSFAGSAGNFVSRFTSKGQEYEVSYGAAIIACGGTEIAPSLPTYGQYPGVITQLELEERLATGGIEAQSVVMLQCAGKAGYCSRVCCSQAARNALRIRQTQPNTSVFVVHRDIRTYAKHELTYLEARRSGVKFLRHRGGAEPEIGLRPGGLWVSLEDEILGRPVRIETDLVVLATGISPSPDHRSLATKLGVQLDPHGFFLEAHPKLRPVDLPTEGIFVCGLAQGPKTMEESIAQAQAAAARAAAILGREYLEASPYMAIIDQARCDGCGYCVAPCSAQAILVVEHSGTQAVTRRVEVDPARCSGCGTCQAVCPKGAISIPNFGSEHLEAMVDALLATGRGR